ncbi:MAG: lysophospholipid acyltransferase family protein [Gemmatimonadota bacterium]|nr:lysophospholipid acyltransferase family protein [Gemmatimonadota bacterium]
MRRRIGLGIAGVARSVLRVRRTLVESQIAASFPERESEWVKVTARGCYRHFGEELAVLAGGANAIRKALDRIQDPSRAIDDLRAIAGDGGSCVIVTGHLGNWELAGAYVATSGIKVTAVARRQRGTFGRRLHAVREGLGLEIVDHDAGAAPVMRALRSGRCVTLVADQHTRRGAEPLPFLGRPAWTSLGPARLAQAAGVPLVFGALVREGEGYIARWVPVPPAALEDPVTGTREWLSYLERAVQERPEQYFWFHRRWRHTRNVGET